jgi:hypothetical protein
MKKLTTLIENIENEGGIYVDQFDDVAMYLKQLEKAVDNLEAILKHVSTSTDIQTTNAVYNMPSHSLRLAADELEKKDADIKKAREFLTTLANASGEIEKDGK